MSDSGSSLGAGLSAHGLAPRLQELARTMKLDSDATIRANHPGEASPRALPALSVAPDAGADLQVMQLLGEGGMGQVRLARQSALDRDVALKMLKPRGASRERASLLLQEGLITGRLEHPNIVPVHLMGTDAEGRPVIVMKRVEGVAWSDLEAGTPESAFLSSNPLSMHLEVFLEVCNAVAFAHARGYVHRDIKPSNVMIGRFGEVYLLDWGISTQVGSGAFDHVRGDQPAMPLGTPRYMAPEMCRPDGVIDERTDIYLLASTLHRLLTGTYRHAGDNLVAVLTRAVVSEPYPYDGLLPDELAAILNRATARRPRDRYATVTELRDAVMAYVRHRGSFELAREAEDLLARLRDLIAQRGEQSELRRTFAECRFAFVRARKEWDGNPRAAMGLQRCLEAMTHVELELGQLDAAQALIDEMPEPAAALQAALDGTRQDKAIAEEQVASLRKLAHELDPTVSKVPRTVLLMVFVLLVLGTVWTLGRMGPAIAQTPLGALYAMPSFVLVYAVAAVAFRRTLLATLFNRRIMILVGLGIFAMAANRVVALRVAPPFEYMLGLDLFLIAVISACGAVAIDHAFYAPAIMWALGFLAIVFLPYPPLISYAVFQILGLLAFSALFYRRKAVAAP